MTAKKSVVRFGENLKTTPTRKRNQYPFDRLKLPGKQFLWRDLDDEKSLRVQASRNGKLRNVVFSVQRTKEGLLVTLEHFREPKAAARLTQSTKEKSA